MPILSLNINLTRGYWPISFDLGFSGLNLAYGRYPCRERSSFSGLKEWGVTGTRYRVLLGQSAIKEGLPKGRGFHNVKLNDEKQDRSQRKIF